jgi:mutator protein MutT
MTINREPDKREYPKRPIVSVVACVFHKDKVLLVKRATEPGKGLWSAPGGAIELGETINEALKREIREECGIEIEVGKVINIVDRIVRDQKGGIQFHYVIAYLLARYVSGEARAGSDVSEIRWVTYEELDSLDMNPVARENTQRAFNLVTHADLLR